MAVLAISIDLTKNGFQNPRLLGSNRKSNSKLRENGCKASVDGAPQIYLTLLFIG